MNDLLDKQFSEDWEWRMRAYPERASFYGDRRYADRVTDHSIEAIERRYDELVARKSAAESISEDGLSQEDQLNRRVFLRMVSDEIDGRPFRDYLLPIQARSGPQFYGDIARNLRFETNDDYEAWLSRMAQFPKMIDQVIELLREGVASGIVHPKVVMRRVPAQLKKQLEAKPKESAFFAPFVTNIDFASLAESYIQQHIKPAFLKLHDYFVSEYLPNCLDDVGVWQLPQGDERYAYAIREQTTTNLAAKEIHEIGLEQVQLLRDRMERCKERAGFSGTLDEFFHFLRTDPQFFYNSADDLLTAYRAMAKEIDLQLVKVFSKLPRTPYGVTPIPMESAPDTTTAYYMPPSADGSRAGQHYVNLYKPETRPKWEMMTLSLHEAVPGHHLQIAYATELGGMPEFRKHGHFTGYIEGWAMHAETLGYDMGFFEDPYYEFGHLTYMMWRAVRLVVDTGIHAFRWKREQAIEYFMQNAAKQEHDVINEIDRYIVWPAQALAYKIGYLKVKELKERALNAGKSIKLFHEAILDLGPLPLDILDDEMNNWIAKPDLA
jgi:uncharacterized protein (DUF885 family)